MLFQIKVTDFIFSSPLLAIISLAPGNFAFHLLKPILHNNQVLETVFLLTSPLQGQESLAVFGHSVGELESWREFK